MFRIILTIVGVLLLLQLYILGAFIFDTNHKEEFIIEQSVPFKKIIFKPNYAKKVNIDLLNNRDGIFIFDISSMHMLETDVFQSKTYNFKNDEIIIKDKYKMWFLGIIKIPYNVFLKISRISKNKYLVESKAKLYWECN